MAELFCSVDRDNRLRPSANRVKTIKACDSVGEEISPFRRACTPREQLAGIPEHRGAEADLVRREVAFKHRTPGPEGFDAGLHIGAHRIRHHLGRRRLVLLLKSKAVVGLSTPPTFPIHLFTSPYPL